MLRTVPLNFSVVARMEPLAAQSGRIWQQPGFSLAKRLHPGYGLHNCVTSVSKRYFITTVVTCEWHQLALVFSHDKAIDLSTDFVENYVIRLANLSEIAACAQCTKNDHSVRHGGNEIGSLERLKRLKSEF